MRRAFTLSVLAILISLSLVAQEDNCSQRYRDKVFNKIEFHGNVLFGEWTTNLGGTRQLRYDVYMPKDDTASLRPLVILWHGGAFMDLFKKNSPDIVAMARDLAKMGYVVISPDYRGIRDVVDFFRTQDLVRIVVGAAIDGNKAICHILSEIDNGNPFRINKDEIFAGGVSGGAVLGLHLIMLQQTEDLPAGLVEWARSVDEGMIDELLANKYCGNPDIIKGFINISGALVDTSFIQPVPTSFLHIHGTGDQIVPFGIGQPLAGVTAAPDLFGSQPVHEKCQEMGIRSQDLFYDGLGHVPFLNIDLESFFSQFNLVNQKVYIESMTTIANFLFDQVTCEPKEEEVEIPTAIRNSNIQELSFYPNPTSQSFLINMPENNQWEVQIFDLAGKIILRNSFSGNRYSQSVSGLSKGMYVVQITGLQQAEKIYTGKIIKQINE